MLLKIVNKIQRKIIKYKAPNRRTLLPYLMSMLENPWWLCTDVSATISKGKFIKWGAHLLWHLFWLIALLFGFAFFCSMVVFLGLLVYCPTGIAGSVVFWLLFLVVLTIVLVLDAKKEGRCPGHCDFLVKF